MVSLAAWIAVCGNAVASNEESWQVKAMTLQRSYQRQCDRVDTGIDLTFSCAFGAPSQDGKFDVILIGDSHSEAWRRGMNGVFLELGLSALNLGSDGTLPFIKTTGYDGWQVIEPSQKIDQVFDYAESNRPRLIILAARWDLHYLTMRPRGEHGTRKYVTTPEFAKRNVETSQKAFAFGMRETLSRLEQLGVPFLVVGPTPHNGKDPVGCLQRPRFLLPERTLEDCRGLSREEASARMIPVESMFAEALQQSNAETRLVVWSPILCSSGEHCLLVQEDTLLLRDRHHLSPDGAELLTRRHLLGPIGELLNQPL